MSANLRAVLIAAAAALVAGFVLMLVTASFGLSDPFVNYGLPALIGLLLYTALVGRKRETKLDDTASGWTLDTARPSGTARLVLRRDGLNGKLVGINFTIDGAVVAQLVTPRYTVLDLAPGGHTIVAQGGASKPAEIDVMLAADSITFVELVMKIGRTELRVEADTPQLRAKLSFIPRVAGIKSAAPVG